MKRYLILLAFCLLTWATGLQAQDTQTGQKPVPTEYTIRHQGMDRTYWLYIPEGLNEGAPLVLVLHGYGGKADGYRPEMMDVAKEKGFAVCYPQGAKDAKEKNCWNVGYPFQEGLKTDDVDFICDLARHLQKKHGLSRENTFLTGMSNGGEMCYLMATVRPDEFAAYAPIAGLTMEWSYKKYTPKKAVPLMEVHGTLDKTSKWEGDPQNKGGWGAYIAVPQAVALWAAEARCTHEITEELPTKRNKVILHRYMGGDPAWEDGPAVEVRLYEVIGGKHTWALGDMDTCNEIWNFFSLYLR
jgi:polyhydroxybutyrate depolymerase